MKKYTKSKTLISNEYTDFLLRFPLVKWRGKFKELEARNGKITKIQTDDPEIIEWIKIKGLKLD
jgi:hypothetical protein